MSTATFKGYTDGTPSGGVATRYGSGEDRGFLELPIGVPVEVENASLAAAKKLAEEKGEDDALVYDIEIETSTRSSRSGSTEGAVS